MLEKEWEEARHSFQAFLAAIPREARVLGVHDVDADGVAAGVVWQRVLERAGYAPCRLMPDRERNVWTPANRAAIEAARPERLFVLDLGSQSKAVLEGVPACFIDHHRPEGVPPDGVLISGYGWDPIPNTSWMMWELGAGTAEVEDLDWIAVIGTLSDLGDKAPWPQIALAKKRYGAQWLREATTLVNATRRASQFNPEAAAQALLSHGSPRELCESEAPEVQLLKEARREVAAALEEAKKAAPVFSGRTALLRVHSPCQVHPLLAQIWRGRLPKYYVLVANDAYMPGRVNFSARGNGVLDFLNSFRLEEGDGNFGHGHEAASGGSLPVERWNRLLEQMGFPASVYAGGADR